MTRISINDIIVINHRLGRVISYSLILVSHPSLNVVSTLIPYLTSSVSMDVYIEGDDCLVCRQFARTFQSYIVHGEGSLTENRRQSDHLLVLDGTRHGLGKTMDQLHIVYDKVENKMGLGPNFLGSPRKS